MAVASAGGHWVQLCRLIPAWDGCDVSYVTTHAGFREKVTAIAVARGQPVPGYHVVQEANRWNKWHVVKLALQVAWLLLRRRPDVIITTGAAPGGVALRLGGLMGCRTVWIDSIANAEELSMTGQKIGLHVDLWLTQWEHLAGPEGPDCKGSVI